MYRKMTITVSFIFAVIMMLICTSVVYADTSEDDINTSKKIIATEALRGTYLSEGTVAISRLSSDEVHIMGVTDCARTSDKVYLQLYLEQKKNGAYGTIRSWKFTRQNADSLAKGIDVLVPSGYYYRLRGYHAAECNGIRESVTTCTGGVMVQ